MLKVYGIDNIKESEKKINCSAFGYNFNIYNYTISEMVACNSFDCSKVSCTVNQCFSHTINFFKDLK